MDSNKNKGFDDILSNGQKYNDLTDGENKNSNKVSGIWSALFLLCMLTIVGGVSYYFIFVLNPKSILVNSFSKMSGNFGRMVEPLKIDYDPGDKFSSTNNLKFNLDGKDIDDIKGIINNSQLSYNLMFDKSNKKMFFDIDSSIDNVKLNLDYYIKDKENYLFIHDIYDKYIKLEDFPIDLFSNKLTKDDIDYIYKTVLTSFNNNLDESFIKRSFSISSNPTVTSTLDMSEGNFVTLINAVRKEVLNDPRINEICLMYITQDDIDKIKEQDLDIDEYDFENFKLITTQSIITDNLNRVELVIEQVGESTRYVYEKKDNDINVSIFTSDKEVAKVTIKLDGKNFDLNMIDVEEQKNILSLTGREDGEYYTYVLSSFNPYSMITDIMDSSYNKAYGEEKEQVEDDKIEMTLRTKFVKSSNLTYDLSFGIKVAGYSFTLSNNGSISPLTTDINIDSSNYELFDSVDEDMIERNFEEKFRPLIEKIQSMMDNNYSSYENNYGGELDSSSVPNL